MYKFTYIIYKKIYKTLILGYIILNCKIAKIYYVYLNNNIHTGNNIDQPSRTKHLQLYSTNILTI